MIFVPILCFLSVNFLRILKLHNNHLLNMSRKAPTSSHLDLTKRLSKALSSEFQHKSSVLLIFRRVRSSIEVLLLNPWSPTHEALRHFLGFPREGFETPWMTCVKGLTGLMGVSFSKDARRWFSQAPSYTFTNHETGTTFFCVDGDVCPTFYADVEAYNLHQGMRFHNQLEWVHLSRDLSLPSILFDYMHSRRMTRWDSGNLAY